MVGWRSRCSSLLGNPGTTLILQPLGNLYIYIYIYLLTHYTYYAFVANGFVGRLCVLQFALRHPAPNNVQ